MMWKRGDAGAIGLWAVSASLNLLLGWVLVTKGHPYALLNGACLGVGVFYLWYHVSGRFSGGRDDT